jgi:hypothetical protein
MSMLQGSVSTLPTIPILLGVVELNQIMLVWVPILGHVLATRGAALVTGGVSAHFEGEESGNSL